MIKKLILIVFVFILVDGLGYAVLRYTDILILDGIEGGYISTGDYLVSVGDQSIRSKIIEGAVFPFIFSENTIRYIEYKMSEDATLEP